MPTMHSPTKLTAPRSPVKRPGSPTRSQTDFKIRVAVRVKPQSSELAVVKVRDPEVVLTPAQVSNRTQPRSFMYDRGFGPECSQDQVYSQFGSDMVDHALEGYNACVFAYGQTGSGKSYTMMGDDKSPGLIPHVCQSVFDRVSAVQDTTAISVRLSILEIYNEQVRDLLSQSASLRVRGAGDDCYVEGLTEYKVTQVAQVVDLLRKGARSRSTAATKMNDQSSRSHAVVSLTIKQQVVTGANAGTTEERVSVLRLVDLAGSERAGSTGATGDRLREGGNINKSLVTLGRVISILSTQAECDRGNAKVVVPYRESILTRLLQSSLGGNSRTAMIACVAPDAANYEQTLSTLRYADEAKRITTKAKINQDLISSETQEAKLATMMRELNDLRQQLSLVSDSQPSEAIEESLQENAKLSKLVQFYEDEAARERVRSKVLESQKIAAERHSLEIGDYLREISGKGLSSIDAGGSFDGLIDAHETLLSDTVQARDSIHRSAQKWAELVQSI